MPQRQRKNRLFTTKMVGEYTMVATASADVDNQETVTAQEDIDIYAIDLSVWFESVDANAAAATDYIYAKVDVSQASELDQDGSLASIVCALAKSVQGAITPNEFATKVSESKYVLLPRPVELDEDETINLHLSTANVSDTNCVVNYDVTVYYAPRQN